MSIYTKSGDNGETGLLGGKRVSKSDLRIEAIGSIDELNASIGVLRSMEPVRETDEILKQIQDDLFAIGAELADTTHRVTAPLIKEIHVKKLEAKIDELEQKLPTLNHFILPTGTVGASNAHICRAVCRRAERVLVALHKKEQLNPELLIYLNRLSDLLFMLAREDMHLHNKKEVEWHAP